jgi:hypothetical protein
MVVARLETLKHGGDREGAKMPSAVFGKWYSINGKPSSAEDGGVMAARGLPFGDYWVASDFVRQLRTVSEIDPWHRFTFTLPFTSRHHQRASPRPSPRQADRRRVASYHRVGESAQALESRSSTCYNSSDYFGRGCRAEASEAKQLRRGLAKSWNDRVEDGRRATRSPRRSDEQSALPVAARARLAPR